MFGEIKEETVGEVFKRETAGKATVWSVWEDTEILLKALFSSFSKLVHDGKHIFFVVKNLDFLSSAKKKSSNSTQ